MKARRRGRASAKPWNGSKWIRPERRLAIYLRDGFRCLYCNRALDRADKHGVTLDHLICRCLGGTNESANLITACRSCNSARQDRSIPQFATYAAQLRIEKQRRIKPNIKLAREIIAGRTQEEELEC